MSIKLLKTRRQEKPAEGSEGAKQQQQHVLENGDVIACRQNGCCSDERMRANLRRLQEDLNEQVSEYGSSTSTTTINNNNNNDYSTLLSATVSSNSRKQHLKSIKEEDTLQQQKTSCDDESSYSAPLVWRNIILFIILHSAIPAGLWMVYTRGFPKWQTILWTAATTYASGLGVTGGAHRLWSHKAYKVRLPVELLLMALQTMAGQNSIYTWCRDHRVHHKFSETNADPHNIKRGFFFAHMGWLCCRKHPEVREKGALIDMSDLERNPVVMFQHRHFWWLAILFTVLLPTLVPVLGWNESLSMSFTIGFMWRYIISLHGTWLVNSAAHYHGSRPYDEHIEARESPYVIWTCMGEGFHNYHHTFPFDYSTSEYGTYFNLTTAFIDACARLGLAYDRRKVDNSIIEARRARTGDQREKK